MCFYCRNTNWNRNRKIIMNIFYLHTDPFKAARFQYDKHVLSTVPGGLSFTGFEQPPQCMPDEYKDDCSIKAYWNYYIGEKHKVANKNESIYLKQPKKVY